LAGSIDPGWTGAGDDAEGLSRIQSQRGRDRVLRYPSGLSGTAGRGPACPVVWEPGEQSPRPPDSAHGFYSWCFSLCRAASAVLMR
jgi:hypothetical protein